ncbi:MAG: hypothetical protein LBI10_07765 [Deltaproteobacteria bacterium]|nr:hypothetical protein [Deltaproteobacteria bacterium]
MEIKKTGPLNLSELRLGPWPDFKSGQGPIFSAIKRAATRAFQLGLLVGARPKSLSPTGAYDYLDRRLYKLVVAPNKTLATAITVIAKTWPLKTRARRLIPLG